MARGATLGDRTSPGGMPGPVGADLTSRVPQKHRVGLTQFGHQADWSDLLVRCRGHVDVLIELEARFVDTPGDIRIARTSLAWALRYVRSRQRQRQIGLLEILDGQGIARSKHADPRGNRLPHLAVSRVLLGTEWFGKVVGLHLLHHQEDWLALLSVRGCKGLHHR